jgi:hypothetical protein
MAETDAVLNAETRRALRRRGRQGGMVVVGAVVTIVIFGVAGLAAILSVPWQLHLAVTVGVTVAIPVAVPYAMLRVLGLSHQDVLYVGKQAYQEGVAEVIALGRTQRTANVFEESTSESGTSEETENSPPGNGERDSTTDESAESDITGSRTQHT